MKVMKATYQIGTGLVLLVAFLLSACSSDDSNDKNGLGRQMHISLASSVYQNDGGVTRSLPMGYEVLNVATAFPSGKDLLAFIANSTNTSEVLIRRLEYVYDVYDWQQNITVSDYTNPYCIYGFVPISDDTSDNASISLLNGKTSYADGVKMTINNLKPMTLSDPCVIVGAKKLETDLDHTDIKLGAFSYIFEKNATTDQICMLLNHLYAKFKFQMKVSGSYAALRTIKVKKVLLELLDASDHVVNTVTATVNIVANTTGSNPVSSITFNRNTTGTSTPFTLFNEDEPKVLTTTAAELATCLAPYDQQRFRLTTDYEVYDKPTDNSVTPQLLKSHTGVTNKFTATIGSDKQKPGFIHTVTITVDPTYLQVLSDYDLDNPTMTINVN